MHFLFFFVFYFFFDVRMFKRRDSKKGVAIKSKRGCKNGGICKDGIWCMGEGRLFAVLGADRMALI